MPSDIQKKTLSENPDQQRDDQISKIPDARDVVGLSEGLGESILTVGNVSEKAGENAAENAKDGSSSATGDASSSVPLKEDLAQIKARLLESAPAPAEMQRQIRREILNEISSLHKHAKKIISSGKKANYFELSNVLKKIRLLKGILSSLLKSSLENLKTLWLRFVHGK